MHTRSRNGLHHYLSASVSQIPGDTEKGVEQTPKKNTKRRQKMKQCRPPPPTRQPLVMTWRWRDDLNQQRAGVCSSPGDEGADTIGIRATDEYIIIYWPPPKTNISWINSHVCQKYDDLYNDGWRASGHTERSIRVISDLCKCPQPSLASGGHELLMVVGITVAMGMKQLLWNYSLSFYWSL